jgi:hypothetical protein
MKRILVTFAVLGLLVLPVLVSAEETWIPPETKWSPEASPPQYLVINQKKFVSKTDEQTDASQFQAVTPAKENRQPLPEPSTGDGN